MDTTNKDNQQGRVTGQNSHKWKAQFTSAQLLGNPRTWQHLPDIDNLATPLERLAATIGKLEAPSAIPELPLERKHTSWMRGGNRGKLRSDHELLGFVSRNLPSEFARISATVIRKLNLPRYSGTNRPRFADIEQRADGGEIQFNARNATPRVRNGLTPDEQCDIHQTVAFVLISHACTDTLTNDDWALCFDAARAEIGADRYSADSTRFVPIESVPEKAFAYTPATRAMVADANKRQRIARAFRKANNLACLAFGADKSRKRKARFLRVIRSLRGYLTQRNALFVGQSADCEYKMFHDLRAYMAEGQRIAMRQAIADTRAQLAQREREAYKADKLTFQPFAQAQAIA